MAMDGTNLRRLAGVALFAILFRSLMDGGAGGDGTTIDGISFPPELKMGGVRQQLTGGGTRTKYGVAKVYAVALYLDSRSASSSLKKFAGAKASATFYDTLAKGSFAKTLFLQFHRSVTGTVVAEALGESLSKRLSKTSVDRFRSALLSVCPSEVPKGTKLYFMCKSKLGARTRRACASAADTRCATSIDNH